MTPRKGDEEMASMTDECPAKCPCCGSLLRWTPDDKPSQISCANNCRFEVTYRDLSRNEDVTNLGDEVRLTVAHSARTGICPVGKC
jgi:hypothetical protein